MIMYGIDSTQNIYHKHMEILDYSIGYQLLERSGYFKFHDTLEYKAFWQNYFTCPI